MATLAVVVRLLLGATLEVMRGCAIWTKCCEEQGFRNCVATDWGGGQASPHNQLVVQNHMKVEEQIRRGLFDVVHIGLDCFTFSVTSNRKYSTQELLFGGRDVSEDVALTIEAHNA